LNLVRPYSALLGIFLAFRREEQKGYSTRVFVAMMPPKDGALPPPNSSPEKILRDG